MSKLVLGCKKIHESAKLPVVKTLLSACFDIHACLWEDKVIIDGGRHHGGGVSYVTNFDGNKRIILSPQSVAAIPTGLIFSIPNGYQMKIVPRSGYAWKNKITVLNSPGTIDEDYTKETMILLYNASTSNPFVIEDGMRIAQGELAKNYSLNLEIVEATDDDINKKITDRIGGFGSTDT